MSSEITSNFLQFGFVAGQGRGQTVFSFDEFRLDAEALMLYRGDREIPLPPKVVRTLAVLVQKRGAIVKKDDLISEVWDDSIVEESNLSQNLYLLRKTLGSRPDGSPYIETLRRRGYRFTAVAIVERSSAIEVRRIAPTGAKAARFTTETRGNVIALVDWKEPEPESPPIEGVSILTAGSRLPKVLTRRQILAALAIAVLLSAGSIWMGWSFYKDSGSVQAAGLIDVIRLTNGDSVNDAAISRDGKFFAYHETDGEYARLIVQQTGQTARVEVLPKARRTIGPKTFSPDGSYIYYVGRDPGAPHNSIFRVPSIGGGPARVIEDATSYPSFSPDGRTIAFQRSGSAGESSLLTASADGSDAATLITADATHRIEPDPAWSPDGRSIAFGWTDLSGNLSGTCTLMRYELSTGTMLPMSAERWDTCYRIEWRNDGKGIVFVGTRAGEGTTIQRDQVYFVSAKNGEARRLTNDGNRHLIFSLGVTDKNEVLTVPFSRSSQIWSMDAGGKAQTATSLTTGSSDGRAGLVPLTDGRIAYTARTGDNLGAWVIDADGSDKRQVTVYPQMLEELRSTPDGRYFFFSVPTEQHGHLFRVNADGSDLKQITTGDGYETDSTVSPDGKSIIFDSLFCSG